MMKRFSLSLILIALSAFPVFSQSILKHGKIPKDLAITFELSSTAQFSQEYIYRITSDGKVYVEDYLTGMLPRPENVYELLPITAGKKFKPKKPKELKLKDRLSKKQLKQIILEIEVSGFFAMNDYDENNPNAGGVYPCVNHGDTKKLSVTIDGKTKKVASLINCAEGETPQLKSFLALYDKVDKELRGVKKFDPKNLMLKYKT